MAGLRCSPNPNLHSQKACNCTHRCPDTQVHIRAHSFQLVRTQWEVGENASLKENVFQ